ncbi:MAG: nitrite reductase/ring-hydroxylating ferredoxin subunit [Bermanella sp.]
MILICNTSDISDNQSKGFNINSQLFFIVNKYGKFNAYKNSCPHLGIQLEMTPNQFLDSTHSLIQCSMHGALFTIENGLCVSGPCLDRSLELIDIVVKDNSIYLL